MILLFGHHRGLTMKLCSVFLFFSSFFLFYILVAFVLGILFTVVLKL